MGILDGLFGGNKNANSQLASIKIGGNHQDYHLGFEVQTADKPMISWDTTYDKMMALPFVKQIYQDNHRKTFCFTIPVRLGNFLIDNLQFYYQKDNRTDMAVGSYGVYVDNLSNAKQLYQEIKNQLSQDWELKYELIYQNHCCFVLDNLQIMLRYCENESSVGFYLDNHKEYPALLLDNTQKSQLTIVDFLVIDELRHWLLDYRKYDFVKQRPMMITERFDNRVVFWREDNGLIGFSANDLSIQFYLNTLKEMFIERRLPYRGVGYDTLCIRLSNKNNVIDIANFWYKELDNYHQALEKLIEKPIRIVELGYDYG